MTHKHIWKIVGVCQSGESWQFTIVYNCKCGKFAYNLVEYEKCVKLNKIPIRVK